MKDKEIRALTKTDCLNWAATFGKESSASAFNHTIGVFRGLLEIGIEVGARYDNPAKFIKRASERLKALSLPEPCQLFFASDWSARPNEKLNFHGALMNS